MSKMLSLKIDVTKIIKEKLFKGEKGTYLDLTVVINNEPNQYGQDVSAWQGQTEQERGANAEKNYLGNGKVFWSDESDASNIAQDNAGVNTVQNAPSIDDDLPF